MPVSSPEFALSRDGKRFIEPRFSGTGQDLWISDEHGVESRFTFNSSTNRYPVWSPDGARIAFGSDRAGGSGSAGDDLYVKPSNNAGPEELLLKSGNTKLPWDWTRDGRFLVYSASSSQAKFDLWAIPTKAEGSGEPKPIPLVQSPFTDVMGQVSPDGRWLAYASDESNRFEVYVIPFAPGIASGSARTVAGKWQVSTAGGTQPRWREDGKELFYGALDRKLMSVEIKASTASFDRGTPQALFELAFNTNLNIGQYRYAPSPDGKRFLVLADVGTTSGGETTPVTLVTNWLGSVKK